MHPFDKSKELVLKKIEEPIAPTETIAVKLKHNASFCMAHFLHTILIGKAPSGNRLTEMTVTLTELAFL